MLYDRWRQVARDHHSRLALVDLARNEQWTFAELAARAEKVSLGPVCYPQGTGPDFIVSVLGGWRQGTVVCPLEPGQPPPGCEDLPPGIVHVKTTSATTGAARMILFTAEQLAADVRNIVATMGLRIDWPNLGVVSMAHSYGFSNLVLPLLLHGIPLFLAGSPMPEAVRRAAGRVAGLTVPAVPALWRAWHEAEAITPNIRLAISAGAPLPLALERAVFEKAGVKLHNFYGASECGGIAYDGTDHPRCEPTLIGASMESVCLGLASGGCLTVRGPAVATGYWPEQDSRLAGGEYQTSDLAELRNGMVYLCGRATDLINVAGRKLAPETVEQALLQCSGVADCLVFGLPSADVVRGDDVVACVVLDSASEREGLPERLRGRLAAWQMPRKWWFVDSLDVNRRGKVSRAVWRQRYLDRVDVGRRGGMEEKADQQ